MPLAPKGAGTPTEYRRATLHWSMTLRFLICMRRGQLPASASGWRGLGGEGRPARSRDAQLWQLDISEPDRTQKGAWDMPFSRRDPHLVQLQFCRYIHQGGIGSECEKGLIYVVPSACACRSPRSAPVPPSPPFPGSPKSPPLSGWVPPNLSARYHWPMTNPSACIRRTIPAVDAPHPFFGARTAKSTVATADSGAPWCGCITRIGAHTAGRPIPCLAGVSGPCARSW